MNRASRTGPEPLDDRFVRIAGGLGILLALAGIVINLVLEGAGPSPAAGIADVIGYIRAAGPGLKLANGLRTAVTALLPVFAVGVYVWLGPSGGGWRMVGLLGIGTVPVLGLVANSAGTIAFWRLPTLAEQPELATMLWSSSVVLFYSVLIPYAVGVAGFSLAGHATARMPRWLWILGLLFAAIGLASASAVQVVLVREWAAGVATLAFVLLPIWLGALGVALLRTPRSA